MTTNQCDSEESTDNNELDSEDVRDLEIEDEVSRTEIREVVVDENGFYHRGIRGNNVYSFNRHIVITENSESNRVREEEIIYNSGLEYKEFELLNDAQFDSNVERAIWQELKRTNQEGFEITQIQKVSEGIELFVQNGFYDEMVVVKLEN
ncbi:hypothetical protein JMJ58_03730 [Haloterrigena salifodinae]|uniref:Uncharacterized protein n=1 Tax=Haloterrigena salifodinae TaxID=2675099 RepID=A0A8T8E2P3_9EURY|nr:hypothetical protein [Haloterrigena salifodinae]QRV16019.1 hypothetical protein JMJ58_03730 [Haloterrigena salifodinae]